MTRAGRGGGGGIGEGGAASAATDRLGLFVVTDPEYGGTGDDITDDTAAITAAVAAAYAAGGVVYWPPGDYRTTATIPNFHDVRHRGPGRVHRDSSYFAVEPTYSQTNTIHVRTSGNDANDGLGSAVASCVQTLGRAFEILRNYGPELNGDWVIFCFAGTYTPNTVTHDIPSVLPVRLAGPSVGGYPNVPTAICNGGGSLAKGIQVVGAGTKLKVTDFKFQNYVSGNLGTGLFIDRSAWLNTINVHASGCDWGGITIRGFSRFQIESGVFTSNRFGVVNAESYGTVGSTDCTFITNTEAGVEFSRGADGHVDNSSFDGDAIGVKVYNHSRVHINTCDFKNATVAAVRAYNNGVFTETANTYNEGTVDANAVKYLIGAYSGRDNDFLDTSESEMRIAYDNTLYQHTGTTSKTTVATPWTIPAYLFEDTTKKLRVRVHGNLPAANTANNMIGLDLGATQINLLTVTGTPAASASFIYEVEVAALAASSQYESSSLMHSNGSPRISNGATAANTTVALAVNITAQLANAAETIRIERVEVWLTG